MSRHAQYLHPRDELINSRLIGEVAPMSDEVIDDLKRAFASMLA